MIRKALQDGDLKGLFVEHLGWDHSHGEEILTVNGEQLTVRRIAHKRGLQVFAHQASRVLTQDRQYARAVAEKIRPIAREHILVVHDSEHSVQVWTWAYLDSKSDRWVQRFHPSFTTDVPDGLVRRLGQLAFSLEEEEDVSLPDVTQRVQEAFDSSPDQRVFFRRSAYASKSHELAMRMRPGYIEELQDFVAFHQRLPGWFAKRYKGHDASLEDVVQLAAIGMTEAAYLFDPTRGTAFSTYAFRAMQTACRRGIPAYVRLAPIPGALYWPYRKVCYWRLVRLAEAGPEAVADDLPAILQRESIEYEAVSCFDRFSSAISLSTMSSQQVAEAVGPL